LVVLLALSATVPCILGPACGAFNTGFYDLGVTTGGVQDIAYARRVIEDGGIPSPDSITVEGLLSEHSIEMEVPPDPDSLFTAATVAWNDDFDTLTPLATVQVGFGTTINSETFRRQPLNLCLVIDRSGSMDYVMDERTRTRKIDAVKIAIDRLLAQLNRDDIVSVVSFARFSKIELDAMLGNDTQAVKHALDDIEAEGATNVIRGMSRGYKLVKENSTARRASRIIVFTDAQVTSGTDESKDFIKLMENYADDEIGATIFGVGIDFDDQLAYDIAQVRGGNLYYLNDYDRMIQVFDEEFDFLVTPVAYDVRLAASIPFTLDVADAYGLPDIDTNTHLLELTVPTLFLSKREGGGAIMIRLRPGAMVDFDEPIELATLELSYQPIKGNAVETVLDITLPAGLDPDAAERYFQTDGTRRGVLLLNTSLVLKNACEDAYGGYDDYTYYYRWPSDEDYGRAIARLTEFLPYFDALAEGLEDQPSPTSRSLSQERALIEALIENIENERSW